MKKFKGFREGRKKFRGFPRGRNQIGEGIKLGKGREKFQGSRWRGIKGRIKPHLGRIKWEFHENVGSRRIKLGIFGTGKCN